MRSDEKGRMLRTILVAKNRRICSNIARQGFIPGDANNHVPTKCKLLQRADSNNNFIITVTVRVNKFKKFSVPCGYV